MNLHNQLFLPLHIDKYQNKTNLNANSKGFFYLFSFFNKVTSTFSYIHSYIHFESNKKVILCSFCNFKRFVYC